MRIVAFLVLAASMVFAPNVAYCKDLSDIYTRGELQSAQQRYGPNLRGLWEEDFLSRLTREERTKAPRISIEMPLIGEHRHPFDYYASPQAQRVFIPIISVKFLDELAIAASYFDSRGCDTDAIYDYVGALRYRQEVIMSPLAAFLIPSNVLDDRYVNDVSGKILKSAIYFLIAHEYAHVHYNHAAYKDISALDAQRQEMEADSFALNVMRRIGVPPMGMVVFFTAASRFEKAPGDFRTLSEYESYLRQRSTHPLTSRRLQELARGIEQQAVSFARLQDNRDLWVSRIKKIARDIAGIGEILDDRSIREYQAQRSMGISLADLRRACRR